MTVTKVKENSDEEMTKEEENEAEDEKKVKCMGT